MNDAELKGFMIELESKILRELPSHYPFLQADLIQVVMELSHGILAQDSKNPNIDQCASAFINQHIDTWNRNVAHPINCNKLLICGSDTQKLVCRFGLPEAQRFAERFSDAWNRFVPTDARQTILEYWRNGSPSKGFEHFGKLLAGIELANDFSRGEPPAKTGLCGFRVCFDASRIFKHTDPEFPSYAIAHELAHVLCYATNDQTHLQTIPSDAKEWHIWHLAVEKRVDEILSHWDLDKDKSKSFIRFVQNGCVEAA